MENQDTNKKDVHEICPQCKSKSILILDCICVENGKAKRTCFICNGTGDSGNRQCKDCETCFEAKSN